MDEAVEAGFFEADGFEKLGALGGFELGDLGFEGSANADDLTAFFGSAFFYGFRVGVSGGEGGFVDVGDVELGFAVIKKSSRRKGFSSSEEIDRAGGLAGFEGFFEPLWTWRRTRS